jgi:hypothetical protein
MSIVPPVGMEATSRWPLSRLLPLFSKLDAQLVVQKLQKPAIPSGLLYVCPLHITVGSILTTFIATPFVPCHPGHHQPHWMELV